MIFLKKKRVELGDVHFQDTKTWVKYSWVRKVVSKINGDEKMKLN